MTESPIGAHRGRKRDAVLIVEDHAMVRQGLALAIRESRKAGRIIEAASLHAALDLARERSDLLVVLFDLNLADSDGLAGVREMAAALAGTPLLVVSGDPDPSIALECVRAGACGFVPKSAGVDALGSAVSLVVDSVGYVPLPRGAVGPVSASEPGAGSDMLDLLTGRQRDVFRLLLAGQSNKEIARSLGVLEGTVKVHVRAIMQRLGVRNRTQVAVAAARAGYFG